jgi:putative transposase
MGVRPGVSELFTNSRGSVWAVGRTVKRAFKYRFYPTDVQAVELARTFGCVRKVYNLALAARAEAWTLRQERVNYNTTSAMLSCFALLVTGGWWVRHAKRPGYV